MLIEKENPPTLNWNTCIFIQNFLAFISVEFPNDLFLYFFPLLFTEKNRK